MSNSSYQSLEQSLGYHFTHQSQLQLALTHRSYGASNNERLEFLGDSLLNLIIGEALFLRFPEVREGQLSRLRSSLVKGDTLAEIAREHRLSDYLILGEGEAKSGGKDRDSILADTVEAIIGAIYIASSFATCREVVLRWYDLRLAALDLVTTAKDAKSQLQEHLQSLQKPLPEYRVIEVGGEEHAQVFTIECRVSLSAESTMATASNRREAEKRAAELMLKHLKLN